MVFNGKMFPVNIPDAMWKVPKISKILWIWLSNLLLLEVASNKPLKTSHIALVVSLIILEIVALPVRCAQPSNRCESPDAR